MKNNLYIKNLVIGMVTFIMAMTCVYGSSHREAPLISNDPLADNVDLYAFRSPDNPDMVTIIATYVPLQLPHGGPNYYTFGQNIRYEIHVDNDANVPGDEITYRFTFNIVNEDPTTFFNIRLGAQNQKATYTLERSTDGGNTFQTIITNGVVPPNNIGPRSIESGVGLGTTYDNLFQNAITTASTGETVFAGPTDDPFFVDLGGIFDLGDAPRQDGTPVDGVACYNVSALAIQVPISTLLKAGAPATPTSILDSDYVIGVWASASRPAITTISSNNTPQVSGDWIQVSRLGMPLTNEAVIPIGSKDEWNARTPYNENPAHFEFFYNPELALYMDDAQFGGAVPAFAPLRIQTNSLGMFDFTNGGDGLFGLKGDPALAGTALDDAVFGTLLLPAAGKPRSVDLWPAFHTGVPNVIPYQLATGKGGNPLAAGKPFVNNFLPNGGDMLRLNMAVPPTPRNDANFSSLGLIQAAAIGLTVAPFNTTPNLEFIPNMDGFPNGRRLEDDVTRIELQAVAGVVLAAVGLWYDDYDPATSPSPVTQDLLNVLTYTTGVESNDEPFTGSFPYLAQPHSGTGDCSGELQFVRQDLIADADTKVFVSSNTSGNVGVYGFDDAGNMSTSTFSSVAGDADGVFYDEDADVLYQLNRSTNVINAYSNVQASLTSGGTPNLTATSSSDFTNGREIAVSGNKLVVAQDAAGSNGQQNAFIIYTISPTSITLDRVINTNVNLWGMTFNGSTLMAVVDNSSDVGIFPNFLSTNATSVSPARRVVIAGLVRTHGITYDVDNDVMVLTDVGSGAVADDGALIIINGWSIASSDNQVTAAEQIRITGPSTNLGNPVDVAYDHTSAQIYVAERANAGGRFLTFNVPTSGGDIAPTADAFFEGASAISLTDCRDDVVVINPESVVYYSLNDCNSFEFNGTNRDYSEFTPAYPNPLSCGSVTATGLGRMPAATNPHSCTPGVAGEAMCFSAMPSCSYNSASERTLRFSMNVNPAAGSSIDISGLTFFEKAPIMYDWIDGPSGPNNYPNRYSVRVLKDGNEIFRSIDNQATTDWTLETFEFSGANFSANSAATFTFEFLGYCPINNGATVSAWDLDEINVNAACTSNIQVALAGNIETEMGLAVETVEVTLESSHAIFPNETRMTDEDGAYAFENLPEMISYRVSAKKNNDYLNGVSTLDLISIQRHILGIEKFESPYKYIAADINQSGTIDGVDLVELRKLILGIYTELPSKMSWQFVDAHKEIGPENALTMDNHVTMQQLAETYENANLRAIKYGDVTDDALPNSFAIPTTTRSNKSLELVIADRAVTKGQSISVPFSARNFSEVSGFQFTMELDGLSFSNISAQSIQVTDAHMGHLDSEMHTISWASMDPVTVNASEVLYTLNMTVEKDGNLSDMISLTNGYTSKEAYVSDATDVVDIKLFSDQGLELLRNELYQNVPNPFSVQTDIKFALAEDGDAKITFYDIVGRIVHVSQNSYTRGEHTISLSKDEISSTSGVLYYKLETNDFTATKKMTLTR